MYLNGVFTMISVESRESNGKTYHNVNIEDEEGKLLRIGCDPAVVPDLRKYQLHQGQFAVGIYNGQMFMRLVAAAPSAGK